MRVQKSLLQSAVSTTRGGQRVFLARTERPEAAHVSPRAAGLHVRFPSPDVLGQAEPPRSSHGRSRHQSLSGRALSRPIPGAADTVLLAIL